jgi:hypothetical protein
MASALRVASRTAPNAVRQLMDYLAPIGWSRSWPTAPVAARAGIARLRVDGREPRRRPSVPRERCFATSAVPADTADNAANRWAENSNALSCADDTAQCLAGCLGKVAGGKQGPARGECACARFAACRGSDSVLSTRRTSFVLSALRNTQRQRELISLHAFTVARAGPRLCIHCRTRRCVARGRTAAPISARDCGHQCGFAPQGPSLSCSHGGAGGVRRACGPLRPDGSQVCVPMVCAPALMRLAARPPRHMSAHTACCLDLLQNCQSDSTTRGTTSIRRVRMPVSQPAVTLSRRGHGVRTAHPVLRTQPAAHLRPPVDD